MTQAAARIGVPTALAIDVRAAVEPRRHSREVPRSGSRCFPFRVALWYGDPVWPFVVTCVVTSGFGLALERTASRPRHHVGVREGFLVVSAIWLLTADVRLRSVPARRRRAARPPDRRILRGHVGLTTTGASVVTDFDGLSAGHSRCGVSSRSGWAAWESSSSPSPCCPASASEDDRCSSRSFPGPEIAALSENVFARRPGALGALRRAHDLSKRCSSPSLGWLGLDDAMTPYEAVAHAFSTMPTGGFSTQASSIAAFSAVPSGSSSCS